MNRSDSPSKQPVPFGINGQREPILSSTPAGDNTASYDSGFPPVTMILKSAGGLPPKGQDMNQILYELSSLSRWQSTGATNDYDAAFALSINGYPSGSVVIGSDGNYYKSTIDNNLASPPGAGWVLATAPGSLIGVKVFTTSTTYTPTQGTKSIIVECQGGGGGGAGAANSSSGSVAASAGGGGNGGCYVLSRLTTLLSSYAVVVGAGGIGGVGAVSGGGGGISSFGSSISAGGGYGGASMGIGAATPLIVSGDSSTQPSGTSPVGANISSSVSDGKPNMAIRLSGSVVTGGVGGSSKFGNGGSTFSSAGNGKDAMSYGAGGGGGVTISASATTSSGGKGGGGVVIVWEYA